MKITLVEASDKVLGAFDERMSKYALSTLEERGVNIQCGSAVTKITPEHMEMRVKGASGDSNSDSASTVQVPFGLLVWAGGLAPRPLTRSILAEIGELYNGDRIFSSIWYLVITLLLHEDEHLVGFMYPR